MNEVFCIIIAEEEEEEEDDEDYDESGWLNFNLASFFCCLLNHPQNILCNLSKIHPEVFG